MFEAEPIARPFQSSLNFVQDWQDASPVVQLRKPVGHDEKFHEMDSPFKRWHNGRWWGRELR